MIRALCLLSALGGFTFLSACTRLDHSTTRLTRTPTMPSESTDALHHAGTTTDAAPLVLPELDAAAADILAHDRYETATFALG